MSYEWLNYQGVGATDSVASKAKGWLYVLGFIGVAVFAMKYMGPGRKKRKNPRKKVARKPARRTRRNPRNSKRAIRKYTRMKRKTRGKTLPSRALSQARRTIMTARYTSERPWVLDLVVESWPGSESNKYRRFKTKRAARIAKTRLSAAARKRARVYESSTRAYMQRHPVK